MISVGLTRRISCNRGDDSIRDNVDSEVGSGVEDGTGIDAVDVGDEDVVSDVAGDGANDNRAL